MRRLIACLALGTLAVAAGEPARIASFSPAATRILVDLGRAERLVATTRWCEVPPGGAAARICDAFEPDLEGLARERPDLVVLPRLANPLLSERIRSAGLRVEVLSAESPDSPAEDIRRLGELTGAEGRAAELLAARHPLRPPSQRRVLIVWDGVVAGPESYLAWVIRAAGARPSPTLGRWPEWDAEAIALTNPDLVLYLRTDGPPAPRASKSRIEEWRRRPGLRSTTSCSKGYIFEIQAGSDWLPASGLPKAARQLADLLEANP
jgi:ABC-type Fe3+-hydroxamate transport system substrate-binding protein